MSRVSCLILASLAFLIAGGSGAETVKHQEPEFELAVPSGFESYPEGKTNPDVLYAFVAERRDALGRPMVILVTRMGERIRDHAFTGTDVALGRAFADLPPNAQIEALRGTWKDFEINIVRIRMYDAGASTTTFVAQVPLKSEAIMIAVAADRGLEEQSRTVLDEALANLEGEGRWASEADWWSRPRNMLIFAGVFGAIAGFKYLLRRN
jgi:hypothetical protein